MREERGSCELERRLKGRQVGQMMGRDSPGSAGKPSRLKLKVLSKNPMLKVLTLLVFRRCKARDGEREESQEKNHDTDLKRSFQVISSREIDEIYFADTQNKCLSDGVGSSLVYF